MISTQGYSDCVDISVRKHSVCIISGSEYLARNVGSAVRDVINTHGYKRVEVKESPIIKEDQHEFENFGNSKYVVLCSECGSKDDIFNNGTEGILWKWYRRAVEGGAKVCVLYINHSASGLINENTLYSKELVAPCKRHVHISNIERDGLFLSFGKMDNFRFNSAQKEALKEWFAYSVHARIEDHVYEWYRDISAAVYHDLQLFSRESKRAFQIYWMHVQLFYNNNKETFARLIPMTLLGILSVFVTLILLSVIASITDDDYTRTVKQAKSVLRDRLLLQRSVNSEWDRRYNGIVVLALQMNFPNWTTEFGDNRRTKDRLEISLLASLSRCKRIESTEMSGTRFPQYISALSALGWNTRDFHGHDLIHLLDDQIRNSYQYVFPGVHTYSWALITLCNAGASIEQQYIEQLVRYQNPDGSFINSVDEAALAVIALSCSHQCPDVADAIKRSIDYLKRRRSPRGSYGNIYTTSLVLQALKAARYPLPADQERSTVHWLSRSMLHATDTMIENVHLSAQVLAALSGKSYVLNRCHRSLVNNGISKCRHHSEFCSTENDSSKNTDRNNGRLSDTQFRDDNCSSKRHIVDSQKSTAKVNKSVHSKSSGKTCLSWGQQVLIMSQRVLSQNVEDIDSTKTRLH